METKKRRLSIKLTSEDFDDIHQKANKSGKNITDYVTTVCLGKQIVVINDLEEVLKQQRAIGRNLNQLATLANMGRISVANLSEALEVLTDISESLKELLERRRWSA